MSVKSRISFVWLYVLVFIAVTFPNHLKASEVPTYEGNINLTASNAGSGLLEFLERNDGELVHIDGVLDTSMSTGQNQVVAETCNLDIEAVVAKQIDEMPLALPFYDDISELQCGQYALVLDLGDDTVYEFSSGGTGIVMIRFKGYFQLFSTHHSGPSIHYHLKEVDTVVQLSH